jgi:hypothetical protein
MAEAVAGTGGNTSRRVLFFLIAALVLFLAGFVPMWMRARHESADLKAALQALTAERMVKDLGSSTIDARRGEYEAARQEASAFFTEARVEIDKGPESVLTAAQRTSLTPLLGPRDELITLLARSDPASADRLSSLYVTVRKALGI